MARDACVSMGLRLGRAWLLGLVFALLGGCGYNTLQRGDEQVKASWAEVLNQYQRRAELVPNLVQVVKAEATFEQGTLVSVVEARARATAIQASLPRCAPARPGRSCCWH